MLPADLTDFQSHASIDQFIKKRLTPHYADVRNLLQEAGYNFIAATGLCSIISGMSVSLFKPATAVKVKKKKTKRKEWWYTDGDGDFVFLGTGELFKALLTSYYPWEAADMVDEKVTVVYDFVRNPLAHSLGEGKKPGYMVRILKSKESPPGSGKHVGWTDAELKQIEMAETRPADLHIAVDGSGRTWDFRVESFYWGVFQLLRRLAKDTAQMTAAESRFSNGDFVWHK